MSKPGKTERALSAIVLLPIGQTWTRRATTLRDCIRGVRLLLTGDLEPPGQEALARMVPGLRVDVLAVDSNSARVNELADRLFNLVRVCLYASTVFHTYTQLRC